MISEYHMNPLFSVVIPTLNEEHYLPNLLEDLCTQKEKRFEVVVVDGSSEDATCRKAESFKTRLNISICKVEKRNLSYQRNYGGKKARGEYLIFLDADIRVPPSFLKNFKNETDKQKHLIFLPYVLPQSKLYQDIILFRLSNFFIETSQNFAKPIPTAGGMIFQKSFFHFIGGYKENRHQDDKMFFPEDHEIIVRAKKAGVTACYIKDVKMKVSLRRMKKEGWIEVIRKYMVSSLHVITNSKVDKGLFKYEMGGQIYRKELAMTAIKKEGLDKQFVEFLSQVRRFFKEVLLEK